MKMLFQIAIIFHTVLYLSACGSIQLESFKMNQVVEITKNALCTSITAQSTGQSCGLGGPDPVDLVCQKRSPVFGKANKVSWVSSTAFTLEFRDGNPFKENRGMCDLDTASTSFECKLKRRPARYIYKYHVVFSETCRKDPLFHIMR